MKTNDYVSLLWILKMSRQNGVVHVELPKAKRIEMGEPWRARLHLVEGRVVKCYVHSQVDGRRLLSDDEAMRWLAQWGQCELAWSPEVFTLYQTAPHPVLRPAPAGLLPPARHIEPPQRASQPAGLLPAARQDAPPQRIVQVGQGLLRSWPRKHRQVFALVDGKRSVGQIAAMLKLPRTVVEEIVNDLQSLGVIRR